MSSRSHTTASLQFFGLLLLVAACVLVAIKNPARLGLDLKGGTRLVLEAEPSKAVPHIDRRVMDSLHHVIEQRVNKFGISEALVQQAGDKRLIVEIPGISDPQKAREQLGKVGQLEFKQEKAGQWEATGLSGKDLSEARLDTLPNGSWIISFSLNDKGTEAFGKLTTALAPNHGRLGIFFDGDMVSAPAVNTPILEGSGYIEGDFSKDTAKAMVDVLNAGALPVNVAVVEESTVGALLGEASLQQSLLAGGLGLGVVLLFMVGFYRRLGLVANLALLVYTLLSYVAFVLLGVTFTLAGIAGFILSIGMAVDANILIFERTKEEVRLGKPFQRALQLGFDRALPSILDSNTTTVLTCLLLWSLGTGMVKGFALTLALGVIISLFTSLGVTRSLLGLFLGMLPKERLSYAK
jgi:preprotein translocase subunit SecD